MVLYSELSESDIKRFWRFVVRGKRDNDCWSWSGGHKGNPGYKYGAFWLNGRNVGAHEVSWVLDRKKDVKKLWILHKPRCHNTQCPNPRHLYKGTPKKNSSDRYVNGTICYGARNGRYTHPETTVRGSKWHEIRNSYPEGYFCFPKKATAQLVLKIRAWYSTGKYSQQAIADHCGVNQTLVSAIVRRRIWRHI